METGEKIYWICIAIIAIVVIIVVICGAYYIGLTVGRHQVKYNTRVVAITKTETVYKNGKLLRSDTTWNYVKPSKVDTLLNK